MLCLKLSLDYNTIWFSYYRIMKIFKENDKENIVNFALNVSFTFIQHSVRSKFHFSALILLFFVVSGFTLYQLSTMLQYFFSKPILTKVIVWKLFKNYFTSLDNSKDSCFRLTVNM